MNPTAPIETLDQARQLAIQTTCAGCQKRGTLSAYQVQKAGANLGRLFLKCRHCGHFTWLTPAPTADTEIEQAQAAATPCPKCGKGRQARRVQKDGPNKGRLFWACNDPACGSFAWASPAPAPSQEPTPRLVRTERPKNEPRSEDGFVAAIRDTPDDDTLRLVYSDWLEEQGESARAELIRVQVEHARLEPSDPRRAECEQRVRAILAEHEANWTASIRPFVLRWRFARGLLDEVEFDPVRLAEHAEDLLRAAPTGAWHVRVNGWQGVKLLVQCKRLTQIQRLALTGERMGGAGARILAESPSIANIKVLGLAGQCLGQPGAQALALSRYVRNLESLDLSQNNLGGSAVPILVSSRNLPRLRKLVLADNRLEDSDARALANSSQLQELQELDLSGNAITREGREAIARSALRARLRRLAL